MILGAALVRAPGVEQAAPLAMSQAVVEGPWVMWYEDEYWEDVDNPPVTGMGPGDYTGHDAFARGPSFMTLSDCQAAQTVMERAEMPLGLIPGIDDVCVPRGQKPKGDPQ